MDDFNRLLNKGFLSRHFGILLILTIISTLILITSCVQNVPYEATYDKYMEQANQAQQAGDYKAAFNIYLSLGSGARNAGKYILAEEAYQQALTSVQLGNLGSEKMSSALYNLGSRC